MGNIGILTAGGDSPGLNAATRGIGKAAIRHYDMQVAVRNDQVVPVPLEDVAGKRCLVPLDHPWIETGRNLGLCFGD